MNSILNDILASKHREVASKRRLGLYDRLADIAKAVNRPTLSMSASIRSSAHGIIAEFKRRSPSKGDIHPSASAADVLAAYSHVGAAACSVLTDTPYFGGSLVDLAVGRLAAPATPLLRKEFIVAPEQIYEARVWGADAILLIAAALTPDRVAEFTEIAHSLSLEVLLELHSESELTHFTSGIDMVGVNNRDLTTFDTDLLHSARLASKLPPQVVKVAESGIRSVADVTSLRDAGFCGFLIGESFMRNVSPGDALKNFINGNE